MYQIGFIKQEKMEVEDNGQKKEVKWLECHFRIAGVRPFKVKMSKNKNKQKENEPDFYLYLRSNIHKGDSFRDIKIGALWLKEKDGEKYLTGNAFIDFKEVNLYVKKAKPIFDNEKVAWLYDVFMFIDREQKQNSGNGGYAYGEPDYEVSETEIDDTEIPF